ncbi:MAG: PAS domain S-box protein [Ignavibacteria bacterium]|nr:PAS domain S-box protein [Ignavibacteria bacterium]
MKRSSEKSYGTRKVYLKRVIIALIILFISAVITAFFYYNRYKIILTEEAHKSLFSISELKSKQLENWIKERLGDGNSISKNKLLSDELSGFENKPRQEATRHKILDWFSSLKNEYGYKSVSLLDTNANLILSEPSECKEPGEYIKRMIKEIIVSGKVEFSDFHFYGNSDIIHLDLMIPVFSVYDNSVKKIITLEIDPDDYIYPLIQSFPADSYSGESLLIKEDNGSALVLNELKFQENTALKFRFDKSRTDIIAVKAINKITGLTEGIDYKNNNVLGVIKPIEETGWILITKINKDEIYQDIHFITRWFIIIITLLLLSITALILLYISRIKLYHRLEESELQTEKESLERYYDVFKESTNDIMILSDTRGNILEINNNALKIYGHSREEMLKINLQDLSSKSKKLEFASELENTIRNGSSKYETVHRKKNDDDFPVEIGAKIFTMNRTDYIQYIIQDITQRRTFENKIGQLNRVYSALSHVNHAIAREKNRDLLLKKICDITVQYGKFITAYIELAKNETGKITTFYSLEKVNGYSEDTKIPFNEMFGETGPAEKAVKTACNVVCNDIENDEISEKWRDKALSRGYKSMISIPLLCKNKVKGVFNIFSDKKNYFLKEELSLIEEISTNISYALETFEKEKEKLQTEENFRTLFENSSDSVILLNKEKFFIFNRQTEILFGLYKEQMTDMSPYELSPEFQPDGQLSKNKALEYITNAYDGKPQRFEWVHIKSDGTEFFADVSLNKVVVDNIPMLIAIVRDITTQKETEQQLISAKEFAEEANRMKTNFLNNMSHEIRTPLNFIIGYSEMLKDMTTDKDTLKIVEIIKSGSMRLLNTLNMILKVSQIESKKIKLNITLTDISKSAEEIVKFYRDLAIKKKLSLKLKIKQKVFSNLDKDILFSILSNLVHNAISYTNKGSVIIELNKETDDDKEFSVIKIKDTGIGIPDELLEVIFEPFRQVSEGYGRAFEGTGLGLTLAKKYVDLMKGNISVSSVVGKGSTFIIKFPLISDSVPKKDTEKETPDKSVPKNEKVKILIVEDDLDSLEYTKIVLRNMCNIDTTDSGEGAIEMLKQNQYRIIIMDIGLKGISGLDAVKIIRTIDNYKNIPIIALTAFALKGDKEKILAGGCSHYISKPFTPKELRSVVGDFLN